MSYQEGRIDRSVVAMVFSTFSLLATLAMVMVVRDNTATFNANNSLRVGAINRLADSIEAQMEFNRRAFEAQMEFNRRAFEAMGVKIERVKPGFRTDSSGSGK